MKSNAIRLKTQLKWTLFTVLSIAAFLYLRSYYNRPVLMPVTSPAEVGVSIGYDPATKEFTVTMDGKKEVIQSSQVASSEFFKQATERVGVRGLAKMQEHLTRVHWDLVALRWLPFELVLFFLALRI